MFAARERMDFASLPGQVQRAHEEAFYWFSPKGGGGLIYPRLRGEARTSAVRKSHFWFYEDASFWGAPRGSVVERARRLAEAITLAGVEVRELRVADPGTIIWQDTMQVLAWSQHKAIPRAFANDRQPPN
ncbi:MAG: hypothetical protein EOP60_08065 [Sphingomonadales bacterium]|nr:MAG: hypothetical protein EOP60_08065 [Sphingomonadales bacterium]